VAVSVQPEVVKEQADRGVDRLMGGAIAVLRWVRPAVVGLPNVR